MILLYKVNININKKREYYIAIDTLLFDLPNKVNEQNSIKFIEFDEPYLPFKKERWQIFDQHNITVGFLSRADDSSRLHRGRC